MAEAGARPAGDAWTGGSYGARATGLVAPNPGMMTLDGTNTWVLREPGATACVVVDPGPVADGHVDRLVETVGEVALVLLTHHHLDHSEAASAFGAQVGAPVRALDRALCVDGAPLADDEELDVDGLALRVVLTPGHTADSVSLLVRDDHSLLTGDMVLGRGTTVVAHPDGALAPYFASVERMRALVSAGEVERLLPGHGPVPDDAGALLDHYLTHRRSRLAQVGAALATLGVATDDPALRDDASTLARRVVEVVYADVDESLWVPAELSVRAQLAYLAGADDRA